MFPSRARWELWFPSRSTSRVVIPVEVFSDSCIPIIILSYPDGSCIPAEQIAQNKGSRKKVSKKQTMQAGFSLISKPLCCSTCLHLR